MTDTIVTQRNRKHFYSGSADIVFVLDASDSMKPVIDKLRENIKEFVEGLKVDNPVIDQWDIRIGFVGGTRLQFLIHPLGRDTELFKYCLGRLLLKGNEAPLVGLDLALSEMKWRENASRIIISFTDEPLESSYMPKEQEEGIQALINKIYRMGVYLFFVYPERKGKMAYRKLGILPRASLFPIRKKEEITNSKALDLLLRRIRKGVSESIVQNQQMEVIKEKVYKGINIPIKYCKEVENGRQEN